MFRASRSVALAGKTGEPLPRAEFLRDWYAAEERPNEFYRGTLVMVAGMPAAYKSMFTLHLVHSLNLPTLYVSADSDAATQIGRLTAMITGHSTSSARHHIATDPDYAERVTKELESSNVQFSFDSNPEYWDIEDEINAWVELYDMYPEVIVIDNLRNVYSGQDNEHGGYKAIQQKLVDLSRDTGACIITMHHMKEGNGRKSTDPAPRNAIDGMISQLGDMILSVAREEDQFRMVAVKNRHNVDHPEADQKYWTTLKVEGSTARFSAQESLQSRANQFTNHDDPYAGMRVGV